MAMSDPGMRWRVEGFWRDFLAVGTAGGAEALAARVTPEVRFRGSLGIEAQGVDGIAAYCAQARRVFRDFHVAVGEVIGQGDLAAARLVFTGVHQDVLFDIPPSGKPVEYDGVAWMRLEGERFADIWVMGDAAEWMTRLRALKGP